MKEKDYNDFAELHNLLCDEIEEKENKRLRELENLLAILNN